MSSPTRSELPDRPNAEDGMTPTSAIANTRSGKARKTSMERAITASTQPPKYPEMMPMTTPMDTASAVARNAMSRDTRAPLTTRARMSRPLTGSTPSGCAKLIPPNRPLGTLSVGSIRFAWKTVGSCTRYGPKMATSSRKRMKIPLPIATLSRFSRIHAIWPSERPSIASPLTPSRIASGAGDSGVISSGAAMMDSISRLFADMPGPSWGRGNLPYLYRRMSRVAPPAPEERGGRSAIVTKSEFFRHSPPRTVKVSCHDALQQVNAHLVQRFHDDQPGARRHRHAGHRDHRAAGRAGRRDPGRRVFEHHAPRRGHAEPAGGQQVGPR